MRNEAEECILVGSLQLFSEQAEDELAARGMEDVRARRFCQDTRKRGLEKYGYRRVFPGDEVLECSVSKDAELTAGKIFRRKRNERKCDAVGRGGAGCHC